MYQEITKISVSKTEKPTLDDIIAVKVTSGEIHSRDYVISALAIGVVYYFYNPQGRIVKLQAQHPIYKNAYVRSEKYDEKNDPLLNLTRF